MNISANTLRFYDLSELALVGVSGEDSSAFLQGQLSNDITQLDASHPHQLSAYCTPKGRVLALFHILKREDSYLLIAPRAIMDKVLPRLRMFVMRSRVEFTTEETLRLYGMLRAPGVEFLDLLPAGATADAHCLDPQRYFILASQPPADDLLGHGEWRSMDIVQNLPQVFLPLYEVLVPQSLNLDLVGAVSFKKGCYPGQEIIARIRYRGKPKTRMINAMCTQCKSLAVGATVYIEERERPAGHIVDIIVTGEGCRLSIAVPVTHVHEGAVYLDEARSMAVERMQLPYEIPA
mgnify:CR=1 FL=1